MKAPNLVPVALALAAALALAGCGVANPFTPAAAKSSTQDQLLKWAQCMRQHGINVPDPVNGRITVQGGGGAGSGGGPVTKGPDLNGSQFQAAEDACKQYRPNGGPRNGQPTQQQLDQMTKFAQCMREHGIPVSDPQVQSGGGVVMAVSPAPGQPDPDPNSSEFQQAQQACAQYQPGGAKVTTGPGGGNG